MFLRRVTRSLAGMIVLPIALAGLLYLTVLRNSFYQASYAERSRVGAAWRTRGFTVAVVWPPHRELGFVPGVQLGVEEANASNTHHLSGKIRLQRFTEGWDSSGRSGAEIAHRVVADGDVVAVFGHEVSASAVPASLTYENHGILFLTPKSTDPRLTHHGFRYTFRLTPNDRQIAAAMTKFAAVRGWKRIGLYFARSPGGESVGEQLISAASENGLDLVFSRSYLPSEASWEEMDFRPMIAGDSREKVDAVMIGDQLPRGAKLIVDLRKMGMGQPIIGCDKLDDGMLWDLAQQAANGVYVASAVDPDATTPQFLAFKEKFRRRWGENPGYGASQGYEAFSLLAQAISDSDSAEPLIVATTIRNMAWKGLFGEFSFTPEGDIQGRHISIKRQENSRFTTIPY